jgi:YD repeat-containing protein
MKNVVKYLMLLLVISSVITMAKAQTPIKKDWVKYGLKSNVQSLKEIVYVGKIVKGKPVKGDTISEGGSMSFTPTGMLTAYKYPLYYGPGGRFAGWENTIRTFNSAGFITEEITEITGDIPSKSKKKYSYKFDNSGNMVSETITPKPGDKYTIKYKYDEHGNCIEVNNNNQITQYKYDEQGRQIAEITDNYTRAFQYDEQGNLMPPSVRDGNSTLRYNKQGDLIYSKIYNEMDEVWDEEAYEYQYDNTKNWTEKALYYYEGGRKKLSSVIGRTITYYSEADIANADVITKKNMSIGGSYLADLKYRLFNQNSLDGTPVNTLLITLISIFILLFIYILYLIRSRKHLSDIPFAKIMFHDFWGKQDRNGMKKLWIYNKEPYFKISLILLTALISFIAALGIFFIFGSLVWGVFWIVKLLLLILIIVGWILLIGGGLAVWGGFSDEGGCGVIVGGIVSAATGGIIVGAKSAIEEAGNKLVETGFDFMQTLNMFQWGINLFTNYWDVLVIIFVAPLLIFVIFALILMLLNFLLRGVEFIVTKIYNIRRPCAECGSTKNPKYLTPDTNNKEHPIALHPGMYGVFFHKSPINGSKLPTMLLNGRWKLKRKCSTCGAILTNDMVAADHKSVGFGTDIHIGIVGHRSSGKSYLLYSGLSLLQKTYPDKFSQIDADMNTNIAAKQRRIDVGEDIPTDNSARYRAIQLILKDKLRPIPYHLYFYDVAGEKFGDMRSANLQTAMDFYKNVQSIVFVIDPLMLNFTGIPVNDDLKKWIDEENEKLQKEKSEEEKLKEEKYRIENSFTILKEILDSVGNKSKKVDFNFVCVKKDLGYFEVLNYNSKTITSAEIQKFISEGMGLHNVINSSKAEFKRVNFYAVSAISKDTNSLKYLFSELLKQQGVKL